MILGPESELPAPGNEKCSCVMCFSKDVPGGLEPRTERSQGKMLQKGHGIRGGGP